MNCGADDLDASVNKSRRSIAAVPAVCDRWLSIPSIWGSIFAPDEAEGDRVGHMIRDFHPDIKGTDHNGERYHALDPEVFWWAHATFTWEFFRARELFFPVPLNRAQRKQLYAESVTWYPATG